MNRIALVGALSCALLASACVPSDLSAVTGVPPNLPPSATVSEVLSHAGVSPAGQVKVNHAITTVQKAALALCGIRPFASGILNIGIGLSPSLASVADSSVAQQIGGAALIACDALKAAPTYTSAGGEQVVRGIAHLPNGIDVPVYGVRLR